MDIDLGLTRLTITPTTQADVWLALTEGLPFPDRDIVFGDLSAKYDSGSIALPGGDGISLSADFSAAGSTGLSIFKSAADALASLKLDPAIMPTIPSGPDERFLLLSFAATGQANVKGSVPIGVVGSATFGVKAGGSTLFAVLYRFSKSTAAASVIEQAFRNVKLPRQVRTLTDLSPGTWIIAEVDGTLGLSAGAKVGYDYSYTRDLPDGLQQLGFSSDLSVRLDAAAQVNVNYTVSGRYFVTVGRAGLAADQTIDLQVNKGSSYGYAFGLNLSAGVQMNQVLPQNGRDLFAASFGLLGPQIVKDISNSIATLEAWSNGDLAQNTAALTISTAKKLLNATTGIDADKAFVQATGVLKDALDRWNALVQQESNALQSLAWQALGNPAEKELIVKLLTDLKNNDSFDKALSDGLQYIPGQTWLNTIAEVIGSGSVLSLGEKQAEVQKIAGYTLDVLSGGSSNILSKLQNYISDRFRVLVDEKLHAAGVQATDPVGDALAAATDPGKLNQWLQDRLAAILQKNKLLPADLQKVQTAVQIFFSRFNELYAKTNDALTKKYNFTFAATYNAVKENNVLLNLSFDLSNAIAATLFTKVLDGDTSAIFRLQSPQPGLTIRGATLSHGIHRTATTKLTIPYLATASADITSSVAGLSFEQNGANLIGYLKASNEADRDRYSSILKLASAFGDKQGALTVIDSSLTYELRSIAKSASTSMVSQATTPFVMSYLGEQFPGTTFRDKFLADLDHAVQLPTSEMGDVLMSMQLAIDGSYLSAWIRTRTNLLAAQITASRVVQQALRDYTHRLYFNNANVNNSSIQPLLVWEAFPVCTGVQWDENAGTLSDTNTGKSWYLSGDRPADRLLRALVNSTVADGGASPQNDWGKLNVHVSSAYQELQDKGLGSSNFISLPAQVAAKNMVRYVLTNSDGLTLISALALAEYGVIEGVAKALSDLSAANQAATNSESSKLLDALAQFGATITSTLNQHMSSLFAPDLLRPFGPMLFVEITRALAGENSGVRSKAMLELKSLKAQHTFDMATYVKGTEPPPDQIAVSQTVVNV